MKMKLLTETLTTLSHFRLLPCHYQTALTSRCRLPNFTQYAESHNLLFRFMTHWYQHHQSASLLQKASYYFRSVSLFNSIDGTSHELSTHIGTLLVITTFILEWSTEHYDIRMDGLQSSSDSEFAYILQHAFLGYLKALKTYFLNHALTISYGVLREHMINCQSCNNNSFFHKGNLWVFVFCQGDLKYVGLLELERVS